MRRNHIDTLAIRLLVAIMSTIVAAEAYSLEPPSETDRNGNTKL
jgi:hypothetical protein